MEVVSEYRSRIDQAYQSAISLLADAHCLALEPVDRWPSSLTQVPDISKSVKLDTLLDLRRLATKLWQGLGALRKEANLQFMATEDTIEDQDSASLTQVPDISVKSNSSLHDGYLAKRTGRVPPKRPDLHLPAKRISIKKRDPALDDNLFLYLEAALLQVKDMLHGVVPSISSEYIEYLETEVDRYY
jgi:hypothetical protein